MIDGNVRSGSIKGDFETWGAPFLKSSGEEDPDESPVDRALGVLRGEGEFVAMD
jgi:hypothetical protein